MLRGAGITVFVSFTLLSCAADREPHPAELPRATRQKLFVMFSSVATRELPGLVRRYAKPRDYIRLEALSSVPELRVRRAQRYVLPTTLRKQWAGQPGTRHWVSAGCSRRGPGTIVYDPEHWHLTPPSEQGRFTRSVRKAAALVRSTGCHRFGLAPGATFMFGMDPGGCSYDLERGSFDRVPWAEVDLVDIQAQLLLSDHCVSRAGIAAYDEVISSIAAHIRRNNAETLIATQVSFRHTPPSRMHAAIARVAPRVDGVFFSYPAKSPEAPCRYCSAANLRSLLHFLRGG